MTERTRILIEAVAFEILGVLNYVLHTALSLPFIDYDKNFAAFFPVIDILFGTYYRPRRDEYPRTGIPAVDFRDTWLRQRSLRLLGFTG